MLELLHARILHWSHATGTHDRSWHEPTPCRLLHHHIQIHSVVAVIFVLVSHGALVVVDGGRGLPVAWGILALIHGVMRARSWLSTLVIEGSHPQLATIVLLLHPLKVGIGGHPAKLPVLAALVNGSPGEAATAALGLLLLLHLQLVVDYIRMVSVDVEVVDGYRLLVASEGSLRILTIGIASAMHPHLHPTKAPQSKLLLIFVVQRMLLNVLYPGIDLREYFCLVKQPVPVNH